MTTQHTPGPWTLVEVNTDAVKGAVHVYGGGAPITTDVWGPTLAASDANARLIAAAPDLLRALSAIVENTDKGYSVTTWTGLDGIADAGSVANLDAARAAIARATGGGK